MQFMGRKSPKSLENKYLYLKCRTFIYVWNETSDEDKNASTKKCRLEAWDNEVTELLRQ
jgi:hypothetical protein